MLDDKLETTVAAMFGGARVFVSRTMLDRSTVDRKGEGVIPTALTDADLDVLADRLKKSRITYGENRAGSCPECGAGCMEYSVDVDGVKVGTMRGHVAPVRAGGCSRNHGQNLSLPYEATLIRKLVEWLHS